MQKMIIKNKKAMPTLPAGRQASRQGFSFLELMITIAIAGIMTATMLVSLNTQRDRKAVEGAAREVAAAIRETQNYALTGKGLQGRTTSCNFTFFWKTTSASAYSIGNSQLSDCMNQAYSLKNGVTFFASGNVSFSVPFSTTSSANIILNKNSSSYHICIYSSGVISEKLITDAC